MRLGQSIYDEARNGKNCPSSASSTDCRCLGCKRADGAATFNDNSIIEPFHLVMPYPYYYIVRAKPGQLAALMQAAQKNSSISAAPG